jgi:hypothetical protein
LTGRQTWYLSKTKESMERARTYISSGTKRNINGGCNAKRFS